MAKNILLVAAVSLVLAGCQEKPGKGEPGAALLDARCSRCHPVGIKKKNATKEEWEQTVTRMIGKGAVLTPAEKTVLVDFLEKYYKK